jgi:hypothetical protein
MGVSDLDQKTRGRLAALLENTGDVVEFDNTRGKPVGIRHTSTSVVQTIPDGVRRVLDLEEDTSPDIFLHPESNAITFVYK